MSRTENCEELDLSHLDLLLLFTKKNKMGWVTCAIVVEPSFREFFGMFTKKQLDSLKYYGWSRNAGPVDRC